MRSGDMAKQKISGGGSGGYRLSPEALDALTAAIEGAKGSIPIEVQEDAVRALRELLARRMQTDSATITAKNPDGVRVSDLAKELEIGRQAFSDIIVETGIGRWIQNSQNRRVMLNHWEIEYVLSASFYPGLLTPAGADAIRAYVKDGVLPKLKGKEGAPLRKATEAKEPVTLADRVARGRKEE